MIARWEFIRRNSAPPTPSSPVLRAQMTGAVGTMRHVFHDAAEEHNGMSGAISPMVFLT